MIYLKYIRDEFNKDDTWDGFMNIYPSDYTPHGKKSNIALDIVFTFNKSDKRIYDLLIKYDLFIEEQPYDDELIIFDIFSRNNFFDDITKISKENIEKWYPDLIEKLNKKKTIRKFKI